MESTYWSGDRLPFFTGHKISWLLPCTSHLEDSQVIFFTILTGFPEIQPKNFQLFQYKILQFYFTANLNDHCSQLFFDVYNVCVAQKLQISQF